MDLRREFVLAASAPSANVKQLCRDFGISRNNGYKWLRRFKAQGEMGLEDQSRRPLNTNGISGETVLRLLELRHRYPNWGAKKMQVLLIRSGHKGTPPSTKTIARIFDRAGEPRVRKPRRRLRLVLREHQELEVTGVADSGGPAWQCQWIVSGHWRRQFYRSSGAHKPRYIAPYVKGPADKPLKAPAGAVFAVTR